MSESHGPEAPPEPKTPMWLPALGAVLFLLVGLLWGLGSNEAPKTETGGQAAADAGAAPAH